MARIFTGGFESGDLLLDGWVSGQTDLGAGGTPVGRPVAVSSSVNEHRTLDGTNGGAFGAKLYTFAGERTMWIEKTLPNPDDCYLRICFRRTGSTNSAAPFLYLFDQDDTFCGSLNLNMDSTDGLSLRGSGGALLATSAVGHTIPQSSTVFTRLEVHLTVSGGNLNIVELRVDDVPWAEMNYSGFGSSTATGLGKIRLQGCWNNQSGGNDNAMFYDDIAVNDTTGSINNGFCGNGFVQALLPNGNGTFSQLTNTAGNSTNNYTYVNTLPTTANGSNAVGTASVNLKDTYAVQDIPAPALGINVVTIAAYASKNGPGVSNANVVGMFNDTEDDGNSIALPVGSPNWIKRDLELNPNTGLPFTHNDINSMEVGIKFLA